MIFPKVRISPLPHHTTNQVSKRMELFHNVYWEIVQRPKLMGGMGVGSFCHHNSTLFVKWIWRFLHERDAFWRKLIVATLLTF